MIDLPPLRVVGDPGRIDFTPALSLARFAVPRYGDLVEYVTLWPQGTCDLHLIGGAVVQVADYGRTYTYPEPHVPWWLRARLVVHRVMRRWPAQSSDDR